MEKKEQIKRIKDYFKKNTPKFFEEMEELIFEKLWFEKDGDNKLNIYSCFGGELIYTTDFPHRNDEIIFIKNGQILTKVKSDEEDGWDLLYCSNLLVNENSLGISLSFCDDDENDNEMFFEIKYEDLHQGVIDTLYCDVN